MIELRRRQLPSVTNALLPKEYQQVEYLQTDGEAYILLNLYTQNSPTGSSDLWRIICDAEILEWSSGRTLFGKSAGGYEGFAMITQDTELQFKLFIGKNVTSTIYSLKSMDRSVYSLSGKYFRINDEVIASTNTSFASRYISIFSFFYSNVSAYPLVSRVYNFKIENEGVALADFYPCYRKADGVAGMFDIVQGIFHVNSNTKGQFSVGANV